ncbi:PREDICTED: turripeptide Lol9.1-like [Branchiostoma belcheri]|uniref:Turripeptide Lol9.1-like n=1 Tax=Branchiostoma belcheri TaxID=7741 RepID=A0A6P4ZYV8_BRABE|nr:PREDICTED: turripeptide Lol9.1-like [Branchiostoma belcheri]
MNTSVVAILLTLLVAAFLSPSVEGRVVPGLGGQFERCPRYCIQVYDPVCGSDGNQYSNSCFLGIAQCRNPSLRRAPDHVCGLDGELM